MRHLPEPFRLFFPLAALVGLAGVGPWVLFAAGKLAYPTTLHAFTMTQSFLLAPAAGFLGTMIPRRTGTPPMARAEAALLAAALLAVPGLLMAGQLAGSEVAALAALGLLTAFVVRRLAAARGIRPVPSSFALLPVGLLLGALGAALVLLTDDSVPHWSPLGRGLAQQGLMLALVMAVAPMLSPLLARGAVAPEPSPSRRRRVALHLLAGALLLASFPLELWSERAGLLLRGAVVLAELALAGGLGIRQELPGLHRRLYRIALALTPAGLLLAGAWPAHRVALLHLTFVGGFAALIFAVGAHVVMLHTGRGELAERSPRALVAAAVLILLAAGVRASADAFGAAFVTALLLSASLWISAAVAWALMVGHLLARD